jgi:hypothetical protein
LPTADASSRSQLAESFAQSAARFVDVRDVPGVVGWQSRPV